MQPLTPDALLQSTPVVSLLVKHTQDSQTERRQSHAYDANYFKPFAGGCVISYLYGGFPAHFSPTSCTMTCSSSSSSIRHNRQTPKRHTCRPRSMPPKASSLIFPLHTRSLLALDRNVCGFVWCLFKKFLSKHPTASSIFNQRKHLRRSIDLTVGPHVQSDAVTHAMLEK